MTRKELVVKVARKTGLTQKTCRVVLDAVFDPDPNVGLIADALARDERVLISGFGAFETRIRGPKPVRDILSGRSWQVPHRRVAAWRPGVPLRELVAKNGCEAALE